MPTVHLLNYVAGNIRSLVNALEALGWTVAWVESPADLARVERLILPGVGHFGHCVAQLHRAGYRAPLREYIAAGKPFMGICVGLQVLCEGSEEDAAGTPGLGLVPVRLARFDARDKAVPHIGWNSARCVDDEERPLELCGIRPASKYYYVHSFAAPWTPATRAALRRTGWAVATGKYGAEEFVGAVARGNVVATQFHPEKSGQAGLDVLLAFLEGRVGPTPVAAPAGGSTSSSAKKDEEDSYGLTRRVIACLDVRANDAGDLVVTKGDQYDVREKETPGGAGSGVRNLGKPVDLATRYYQQGADEITFLNITSFRNCPVADAPMLEVLRRTSARVFVPLTVGGGIRDTVDPDGSRVAALDVASMYFRSGADKVSLGSDAVLAAEAWHARGGAGDGTSAIETISAAYGAQAVVVSIDPRRVYVADPADTPHHTLRTAFPDSQGRSYVWYQCTIKGGREARDTDVRQVVTAVQAMGAGEILLNCIDRDGGRAGFDLELVDDVKSYASVPVVASSGAGCPQHFEEVFTNTACDAALGAGMFHRNEFSVADVKA
ncbi:Histidine biosynthesis bifunctional protein hisB, partial [Ascosphaera acerosa]